MNAAQVANALGGAKQHGSNWSACCPAHDDRRPSLSLDDAEDGKLLYHCRAGCSQEQVRAALLARGLLDKPEPKVNGHDHGLNGKANGAAGEAKSTPLGRIVATYDYVDANGELLFQVIRYDPKDFRQRRPDGNRGWVWKVQGIDPVPYRLPELMAAPLSETVFIPEGEKDVDNVRKIGLVATCNPRGKGNWSKELARYFKGRNVVLLADNDEAGRDHVRDVEAKLRKHATSIVVVELPGLPPKGDVSNWLDAGGTVDELHALVEEARAKASGAQQKCDGAEEEWGGWPGPDPAEMHTREGAEPEPDPEPPPPSFWDPFDEPKPPEFPRGVLSWGMEQTVFALAKRDGVDPGAQAMAYLAAGSGAAHKAARFFPYANSDWGVPAILWVMLLALSGQRKTPVINNAFNPLRARDREAWAEYSKQKKAWEALPKDEQKKTPEPEEPHTVCVGDVTIEKLQIDLARSGRGAILVRDELADLLGFGAYSPAHAAKERAYYLQAYEGGTYHVGRVGRGTVFIEENALSLYGAIPPARLADFKDLDSDGFMQRMCVVRAAESASADPDVKVEHRLEIDGALTRLTQQTFGRQYFTDGGELIRETEQFGVKLASIADYGLGFQGFCSKLHGLHARLALVLHLLDNPDETMVPVETVMRAKRLLREYLLPQTLDFYSSFSKSGINRQRDVASWILTRAKDRFVASDLTAAMKWCRNLTTKQMNEMLEPLVNGGWLTPEEPWPQINRGWKVTPGLGHAFAERARTECTRRAEVRDLIARAEGRP